MADFLLPGFDVDEDHDHVTAERVADEATEEELERRREWLKLNRHRHNVREEYKAATATKSPLPPEYLRKIIRDHGDLSDPKFRDHRRLYIGALRFVPHAILKLMECIPMPWEDAKMVNVVYHTAGAITIVNDTPKCIEAHFRAQWGAMWVAMRREKRIRGPEFQRVLPEEMTFPNGAKPIDYGLYVADQQPPAPVRLALDEHEDGEVADWFYDQRDAPKGVIAQPSRPRFRLTLPMMGTLLRHAAVLHPDRDASDFLWSLRDLFSAKAMNIALPGGPKFQKPVEEEDDDEEWTDFNDLGKVIVRQPFTSEMQLAHPWLYAKDVNGVQLRQYRSGHVPVVASTDVALDAPAFSFSAAYNPIVDVRDAPCDPDDAWAPDGEDDLVLPSGFTPFAADVPLDSPALASSLRQGIDLLNAPAPFNRLVGPLRRPVDVTLVDAYYKQRAPAGAAPEVKSSYQKLLKGYVKRELRKAKIARSVQKALHDDADAQAGGQDHDDDGRPAPLRRNRGRATTRVVDALAETKFFQKTSVEWLEAGMQLCFQGHTMLTLLLKMRNMTMVHIDYNFNAEPTKTLSTKERKKTRLGQSFNLVRELLKLVKIVVDLHLKFRLGKLDAYQLADALNYTFTHMGKLTTIYRHKFKTMRQIGQTKDLKHLIYSKFNTGEVGEGPGAGFWLPSWRIWMLFLRGITPLLQRYLSNLLTRLFEGRKTKGEAKRLTKQRVESNFDLNLKAALKQALIEALPEGVRAGTKARVLESHASEAWRCWRANIPWVVKGMPPAIENLIRKYVKEKADYYVRQTYYNRERIMKGDAVDKGVYMKNLGRITRLKLRDEQDRQAAYLASGPRFTANEAVQMYKMLARWLESRNWTKIEFPRSGLKNEKELLAKSLDRLRSQHNVANRLTNEQREEQKRIEDAYDAPQETLAKLCHRLARTRIFKPVQVEFMDGYTLLAPVYSVDPVEKMTDAFLDSYLWYEASRKNLFPSWVKPADTEPPPMLAHLFCRAINNAPHIWETNAGEATVLMQASIEDLHERVDWSVMKSLLGLVMDPVLVAYICARHDVKVEYKDMSYEHHIGLIRGYQFASFLAQFWGFVCDLLLIGPERAAQLAGPAARPNPLGSFADPAHATSHPIRLYMRYLDRVYILLRYDAEQAQELVERFFDSDRDPANLTVAGYKNKRCWPRDARMRLKTQDVNLGRAVHWDFRTRLPPGMGSITWDTSFVSVYSDVNPNLLFDLCGFDIRILPLARTVGGVPEGENIWPLRDNETREITARAFVQVSADHVIRIQNKIRRCILSIGNSPFHKIATKWNSVLMEIVPYYREAILGTDGLQLILQRGESKVQTRIKMALNSKNSERFPPVVFYSPPELGGLGMLSVGNSLIPAKDRDLAKLTDAPTQHFLKGMTSTEGDVPVPNVMNSYPAWHREFNDSGRAWAEYRARFRDAKLANRRLSFDEVEDLLDHGIPRIRTLFTKDRRVLEHDRGWRVRQEFMQYQFGRYLSRWWYSDEHDGRLCVPLDDYKETMLQALGGVDMILEHTLFAGTGFTSWEGLFWDKKKSFEERVKNEKLTKAQRTGLTKVPNWRFALWWSPTINRSSVYTGYCTQLDLTGIMMTGKLEMIKAMYIKLFAEHLWEKIHRSITGGLLSLLSTPEYSDMLHSLAPEVGEIPPKKALTLDQSWPDIILRAASKWPLANPSQLTQANDAFDTMRTTQTFWIDIQLRWGDYDKHNTQQHAKEKYLSNVKASAKNFPNATGIVILIDLAYNAYAAYGYWIPELKKIVDLAIGKMMRSDPALNMLRSRMHKELQLYSKNPTESSLTTHNFGELFGNQATWFVDDSAVNAVAAQSTTAGNRVAASKNGALIVLNPKTGKMLLSVIHKSALANHKRRTKLSREKAAEEVVSWLRSLPEEEWPNKIIVTRRTLFTTVNSTLIDFPNIGLGRSDLNLPLKYLLYHDRLLEMVTTATESKSITFNVFDDWPLLLSPVSCFKRLLLILRGLHVNIDRTRYILNPPDQRVIVEPHHFWPTLTTEQWVDIERQLHDIILADYARRNSISVTSLTSKEAMDIIMGKEVSSVEVQADEMNSLQEKAKKTMTQPTTVQMVNKRGEEISVRVNKAFDIEDFTDTTSWRKQAKANAMLQTRLDKIYAADISDKLAGSEIVDTLVFPASLMRRFLRCADVSISTVAVAYGFAIPENPEAREVRCLLMPPQEGRLGSVAIPTILPQHELFTSQGLEPVGIIRTQSRGDPVPTTNDLGMLGRLLADNEHLNPQTFACVNVVVGHGECTVGAAALTDAGIHWSMERRSAAAAAGAGPADSELTVPAKVMLSERIDGFVMLPAQGSWNYYYRGQAWAPKYAVAPGVPLEFHHMSHRPRHFLQFAASYDGAAAGGGDEFEEAGSHFD